MNYFGGILSNPINMVTVNPQSSFEPLKLWNISNSFILSQRKRNLHQLFLIKNNLRWNKTTFRDAACFISRHLLWLPTLLSNPLMFFYSYSTYPKLYLHRYSCSLFESSLHCRAERKSHLAFLFILSSALSHNCWSALPLLLKWPLSESSYIFKFCLKLSS